MICRIAQGIESKFWTAITPIMTDEGFIMKTVKATKQVFQNKALNIALLILVWAAIGFVSGMIIGRIIFILQLL